MTNRPELTHEQVVAYLRGDLELESRDHLLKLRQNDSVVQLFVDFVDKLKNQATLRERPSNVNASYSFAEIDDLLAGSFAGTLQPVEAQKALDHLMFSSDFFRRLLIKFEHASPQIVSDDVLEIAHLQARPDEEILAEIVEYVKGVSPMATGDARPAPQPSRRLVDRLRGAIEISLRLPRYAWVLVLLFLGSTGTWVAYDNFFKQAHLQYYVYDDRVPYEYDVSGLRDPATSEKDPRLQAFINQFMLGISDYMIRDYASAILLFEQAEAKMPTPADSASAPWRRDLNFYRGLSHLALSIDSKLTLENRAKHQQAAIQQLGRADGLVREYHLQKSDRETYFLGLAYGLSGQREAAVAQLEQIEPGSRFYQDRVKLIHQWLR